MYINNPIFLLLCLLTSSAPVITDSFTLKPTSYNLPLHTKTCYPHPTHPTLNPNPLKPSINPLHKIIKPATTSTSLCSLPLLPSVSLLTSGLLAGSLHAISGPDHLVSLLPRIMGQRWYKSIRVGAIWGMGHGISAMIIGGAAYGLKNAVSKSARFSSILHGASLVTELAVGLSLIAIGVMGLKEAREWKDQLSTTPPSSLSASAAPLPPGGNKSMRNRAILLNGLLHGFSWDGAPSLAGSLAVKTWRSNVFFLLAYALGTVVAMSATTTVIGEGTVRMSESMNRPDVPVKLSFWSSVVAIGVGCFWFGMGLR